MAKLKAREIASVAAVAGSTAVLVIVVGLATRGRQAGGGAPVVSPLSVGLAPPPVTRVAPNPPPLSPDRAATGTVKDADEAAQPAPKPQPPKPATPPPSVNAPSLPGGSLSVSERATQTDATHVVVVVSGAVAQPGLYTLARGARVADALHAAGGVTTLGTLSSTGLLLDRRLRHSDQVHVPATAGGQQNKRLTAAKVPGARRTRPAPAVKPLVPPEPQRRMTDGKLALPSPAPVSETAHTPNPAAAAAPSTAAATPNDPPDTQTPATAASPTTAVNLNTADAGTLQKRLGIGPLLAARIVAYRREAGGFKSPEQLLDMRGMTETKFNALQGHVRTE